MEPFEARVVDGVIVLAGEFDLAAVDAFWVAARDVVGAQQEIVVDLERVTFMDSTAIRQVLKLNEEIGRRGVVLRRPDLGVRRVLETINILGRDGIRIEH